MAQCAAKSKQSGERCKKDAVASMSVCHIHGGKSLTGIARDDVSGFEIERQNTHYSISANALMGYIEQHATTPGVHAPVCQRANMPLALHIGNSDDVYSHDDTQVKVKRV